MCRNSVVEIQRRGATYVILAPQFGVIARNNDLAAGLREAELRIKAVAAEFDQAGIEVPSARDGYAPTQRKSALSAFWLGFGPAVGSSIVLCGLILLASVPLFSAAARLQSTIEAIGLVGPSGGLETAGRRGIDLLVRAGETMEKMTPERKAELRLAVHRIMQGLSPIIEEVGDSVERDAPTPPPAR